jgi:hypothetical protein
MPTAGLGYVYSHHECGYVNFEWTWCRRGFGDLELLLIVNGELDTPDNFQSYAITVHYPFVKHLPGSKAATLVVPSHINFDRAA